MSEITIRTSREHADILQAIRNERDYQDDKWGRGRAHSVAEWLLIMELELIEAKEAWCKGKGDPDALQELLQVVAVGFACMEQHGVRERAEFWQAPQESRRP